MSDDNYSKAKALGLTDKNRWEDGINHHKKSEELMSFIQKHDFNDYDDFGDWNSGGDGDNGEVLMFEMDAFFELKDIEAVMSVPEKNPFELKWEDGGKYELLFKGKPIGDGMMPPEIIQAMLQHMNFGYQEGIKDGNK